MLSTYYVPGSLPGCFCLYYYLPQSSEQTNLLAHVTSAEWHKPGVRKLGLGGTVGEWGGGKFSLLPVL